MATCVTNATAAEREGQRGRHVHPREAGIGFFMVRAQKPRSRKENLMTRSGKIRWVGCTIVALLVAGHTASSQSLKLDAHGFLIAPPEAMKPAEGSRSVTFGDPSKPGIYVTRITWAPAAGRTFTIRPGTSRC